MMGRRWVPVVGAGLYLVAVSLIFLLPPHAVYGYGSIWLVVAFLTVLSFMIVYQVFAAWKANASGIHLMWFTRAETLILGFIVLAVFDVTPDEWEVYLRAWIYLTLASVLMWRLCLLGLAQYRARRKRKEADT